jgi:hypothetical protein
MYILLIVVAFCYLCSNLSFGVIIRVESEAFQARLILISPFAIPFFLAVDVNPI